MSDDRPASTEADHDRAAGATLDAQGVPVAVLAFALLFLPLLLVPRVTLSPSGWGVEVPVAFVGAAGLVALFGLTLLRGAAPGRTLLGYAVAALALAGATYAGWLATEELWGAALVLVLAGAVGSYGLHRHERVVLGLAGGEDT